MGTGDAIGLVALAGGLRVPRLRALPWGAVLMDPATVILTVFLVSAIAFNARVELRRALARVAARSARRRA